MGNQNKCSLVECRARQTRDKQVLVLFIFAVLVLLKDGLTMLPILKKPQQEKVEVTVCNDRTLKQDPRLYLFCGKPVPVNSADQAILDMLPGIGPYLAEQIITYRLENGPFTSQEDLLHVPGIGAKILGRLTGKLSFD